jgi:hypothetical protein
MTISREPLGSSSSSAFDKKNQEMTMSREVRCHLLQLRIKPRNDDEPLDLSSSSTFVKKNKEMTTSWDPNLSLSSTLKEKKPGYDEEPRFIVVFNN